MLTHNDVKKRLLVNLQDYPEIALRYEHGDPTVLAPLQAMAGMIADQSRDIQVAKLEPFIKSNARTILADATNKGIIPLATACQHWIEIENKGERITSISAGRYIFDGQGRTWRLLQTATVGASEKIDIQVEQSEIRIKEYQAVFTDTFHQVKLDIQDDVSLCDLHVYDDQFNTYLHKKNWMNCPSNIFAYTLKTDTMRSVVAEFGDSERCGTTLQANTIINFEITETEGYIDISQLLEASLESIEAPEESKVQIKFKSGGVIRMGGDPLSINQLGLLASYPIHNDDDVFQGDFDYSVRRAFMSRCDFVAVWNEAIHEKYYDVNLGDINHLQVAFSPSNLNERDQILSDIKHFIGHADNLYQDRVRDHIPEERLFHITINAKLAAVHNADAVREQISTLLLARYGRQSLATSYFLADGFNTQEIAEAIKDNIIAFQDHISDFNIEIEDLSVNPIKPHQWTFVSKDSISINIKRTATAGASLWTR